MRWQARQSQPTVQAKVALDDLVDMDDDFGELWYGYIASAKLSTIHIITDL